MITATVYPGNAPKRRYLIHYYARLKRDASQPGQPTIPADAEGKLLKREHKIDKIEVLELDESGNTARVTVLQEWEIGDLVKQIAEINEREPEPVNPEEYY